MKNRSLVFLIPLIICLACDREKVVVRGVVDGGARTGVSLERLDINRTTVIDSLRTGRDGSFSFSTRIKEPQLLLLRNDRGEILNLLPFPGERISVSTTYHAFGEIYSVEGSPESEKVRLLVEHLHYTRTTVDSLVKVADSIMQQEDPRLALVRTAYTRALVDQKRFTIRFLVENMHSLASIYALYQKFDEENFILGEESDLQYYKVVADSLENSYPGVSLVRSLRRDIEQREAIFEGQRHMEELISMADETGLPQLSIPDRDGNAIALSDLEGRVVLVIFWASGNEASVRALIRLQSTYDRYHDKGFEVYAISLDNDRIRWMNTIDFNEFNWINVSELSYPDSKADMIYNVNRLPAGFLVNREGEIVARDLYGRTLETWLDNLL
ncbi:MAG TPA: redoxin domain-containing protein [Bacteroides sp.]|nr:redoxin domain-containing protein [Bacteroides sp.]